MAGDTGRHGAGEDASDRARIDYLSGDRDADSIQLDAGDRAELDELSALLADPSLWAEPPAELEDTVVALIAAEAAASPSAGDRQAGPSLDNQRSSLDNQRSPFVDRTGPTDRINDVPAAPPAASQAPIDLASARRAKERRTGGRRFTRPAFLIAAAAAVVAVALSAVLLLRDSPAQRRFDVALSATELAPGASGSAVMLKTDSGWEIKLDATGLPRLDGGRFYQAWLRNAGGVLVPIGTFNEGTDVTLWAGVSPQDFATMTITQEAADGVQDSSGQRVLVGTAVED